jgi:hypothetical protein
MFHTKTQQCSQSATVSNSRCLVTDPTDRDSSFSVLKPLVSGELPATKLTLSESQLLTLLAWGSRYIASGRAQEKTLPATAPLLQLRAVA